MGLTQLDFNGHTKIGVALMRLKEFEPPEGYYLAFSGGKDSIVIYDLAVKSGVKFDAHYNMTGIDPPELVYFIREHYPDVECHRPPQSIWRGVEYHGLPRRQGRWCCELLKEGGGTGRKVITGVRWAESVRRQKRRMVEVCRTDTTKWFIHPIIDWDNNEVWEYIHQNKMPYCSLYDEGFIRLGCIMCPMLTAAATQKQKERWPKIAEAWRRAAIRYWERGTDGGKKFKSGEELFEWWLSRKAHDTEEAQCVMFE